MSAQLEDEILSTNAIYTSDTLTIISNAPIICALLLPGQGKIVLRLEFPDDYPDSPPSILSTQSVGEHVPKGLGQDVVEMARNILAEIFLPGSPCIFDLMEELEPRIQQLLNQTAEDSQSTTSHSPQSAQVGGQQSSHKKVLSNSDSAQHARSLPVLASEPPWILSEVVEDRKSVFVARAVAVSSTDEAKSYLHHLLSTDKKAAKADHNITAWQIHGEGLITYRDCDDDGEDQAGSRVLHLLEMMDAWNVMVVVTRWYGGTKLGSDRFRIISSVARDAVVKGGFGKEAAKKSDAKKSRK